MDQQSVLASVENNQKFKEVAQRFLAGDSRMTFHVEDAAELIARLSPGTIDLIFADTWAGKYTHLDGTLKLLKPGGLLRH